MMAILLKLMIAGSMAAYERSAFDRHLMPISGNSARATNGSIIMVCLYRNRVFLFGVELQTTPSIECGENDATGL